MLWLGIAIALVALAAIFAALSRAMRKTRHNESWGVGEATKQWYGGLLPTDPPGSVEIVNEPDEDERRGARTEAE